MNEWKETDLGLIPQHWEILPADKYCIKVTDGTHDSPKQQKQGKHLITSKHIKNKEIDFDTAYLISEDDFNEINRRSKVDQWDLIISMIGEYCGFVYLENNKTIDYAVKNVGLFKVGNEINARWLYYYFISDIAKNQIRISKTGTSQPYLTLSSLREFPILDTSNKEEKNAIVSILSSLDNKIDLLRRQNQTLEQLAQTIFKHWFVHYQYPGATGEMETTELGNVPKGWKMGTIGDIASISKDSINPAYYPDKTFRHYSIPCFDTGKKPTEETGSLILSNKFIVKKNSILVSKLNPQFPRVWLIDEVDESESICSTEF